MDIGLILMIFTRYGHLIYVNIHTKNEENLPSGSRVRNKAKIEFKAQLKKLNVITKNVSWHTLIERLENLIDLLQ